MEHYEGMNCAFACPGMRWVFKFVARHPIFNGTRNLLELLCKTGDCFALRLSADAFGEALGSVIEKEEMVDEMWKRSPAVNEAFWYVT